jgi:hypothetical protein
MEILQGMKDAIEARLLAIDAAIKEADDNLAADKANKLKYQIDIVTLSNTADKEKSNANTGVCVCVCIYIYTHTHTLYVSQDTCIYYASQYTCVHYASQCVTR